MSGIRYLLITIDTEGDNLWRKPRRITTENARYLDRFQRTCEGYGFKPTYLVNYEMAISEQFQEFGSRVLASGNGEIGMHLHAWNSLPDWELTKDDRRYQPFLIEYPLNVMRDKIAYMTSLLCETFARDIVSHRAGRWAINNDYIKILAENGYKVDCSVTPFVSWKMTLGSPQGCGGPDYSHFPDDAYVMNAEHLDREGDSPILQVPMSIMPTKMFGLMNVIPIESVRRILQKVTNRFFPSLIWLRPNGRNRSQMQWLVRRAVRESRDYIMFMLHSSELMPGGSSRFNTEAKIEALYDDINAVFSLAANDFAGASLSEYRTELLHSKGRSRS